MKSNFEFAGASPNYQLIFIEVSSNREYFLSAIDYPGCTKDNVYLREGDLVLLPCKGSTSNFDAWNIRENHKVKKWVQIDDSISGY